jgi:hypothetical protein
MTRNELCKIKGITPKTSFDWQKAGMPKKLVVSKGIKWRWDFDIAKVDEWLEQRKVKKDG